MCSASSRPSWPIADRRPAIADLLAGQIDLLWDQVTNALPQIQAGTLHGIAITSPQRLEQLKDVPTTAELGMPEVSYSMWHGLYVAKGTPKETIGALNAALRTALADPVLLEKLKQLGTLPFPDSRVDAGGACAPVRRRPAARGEADRKLGDQGERSKVRPRSRLRCWADGPHEKPAEQAGFSLSKAKLQQEIRLAEHTRRGVDDDLHIGGSAIDVEEDVLAVVLADEPKGARGSARSLREGKEVIAAKVRIGVDERNVDLVEAGLEIGNQIGLADILLSFSTPRPTL